jgi:hypothetical protein
MNKLVINIKGGIQGEKYLVKGRAVDDFQK